MSKFQAYEKEELRNRSLFSLHLEHVQDISHLVDFPSHHFVCLIAWDSSKSSVEEISLLAKRLLDEGAAYVCTWGEDCERVHDIFDEVLVMRGIDSGKEGNLIMTTWHSDEELFEAIYFALADSGLPDCFECDSDAILGISIGSKFWAEEIHSTFSRPNEFRRSFLGYP